MNLRPEVHVDLLLGAVSAGTHRVTVAMIHPDDLVRLSPSVAEGVRSAMRVNMLIPDSTVERGYLFVNTTMVKR